LITCLAFTWLNPHVYLDTIVPVSYTHLDVYKRQEYESGEISLQEDEIADAQFFKFDQLPEIPFKGSIAHAM
ncbi:hypothetical protein AB723_19385, partial [Acinetobacter baumannii]